MKLVIANKNYSSWSLRAWLLLRHFGIAFEEEKIGFNAPDFKERVQRYSPVGRVPVLVDGDVAVWDSLAIAEYVAEKHPAKKVVARRSASASASAAICAEMHSGFGAMRRAMGMNCELVLPNVIFEVPVQHDIERMIEMWRDCRGRYAADGAFLFGAFSIADAFFAPVTRRFLTYATALPDVAERYVQTISNLPAMKEWLAEALSEHEFVEMDEPYRLRR